MLPSKRMRKKRPAEKKSVRKKPVSKKSAKKKPVSKKSVKRSPRKKAIAFTSYERQASQTLQTLLPYASGSKALRKKAGFPASTNEPSFGLDVTFVDRAKMRSLNRKFRGKNQPTDVLSFPALEIFARQGHLGDLVICAPIMEVQAKEIGHSTKKELDVLLVHGLLHLLGYDHEISTGASAEMSKWELKILGDTGLIKRANTAA